MFSTVDIVGMFYYLLLGRFQPRKLGTYITPKDMLAGGQQDIIQSATGSWRLAEATADSSPASRLMCR